jgi:GNAT superfamily N-acetyltransferase
MRTVGVGDREILVGGVGGLVTVPAVRGQGHAVRLLEEAGAFVTRRTAARFLLLFCLDPLVPFYRQLGWAPVEGAVSLEQPDGPVACPLHTMWLPIRGEAWPAGAVDVRGLPW